MELYATHLIDDLTALELPSRALSMHASVHSWWSALLYLPMTDTDSLAERSSTTSKSGCHAALVFVK